MLAALLNESEDHLYRVACLLQDKKVMSKILLSKKMTYRHGICPKFYTAGFSSIKHDLARSCFKFWLKIGNEGDKISRKKTGEALAETVFSRNFVTLGADF